MKPKKDPCKVYACKLQKCLTDNNFQESRCLTVLEEFRQCCIKWGKDSFVCDGIKTDKKRTA